MNFTGLVQKFSGDLTLGQFGAVISAAAKMDEYLDFKDVKRILCNKNMTRIDSLIMKSLVASVSDLTATDALIFCLLFALIAGALAGLYRATRKIVIYCKRPPLSQLQDLPPPSDVQKVLVAVKASVMTFATKHIYTKNCECWPPNNCHIFQGYYGRARFFEYFTDLWRWITFIHRDLRDHVPCITQVCIKMYNSIGPR